MERLFQYTSALMLLSVSCLRPVLAQSFTSVTTQIRTPYGNVPHTYYVPSVDRYYNLGGISQKYDFTVVLTNEEELTFNAALNLIGSAWQRQTEFCTDSIHFYSGGKYREYYCGFQEHMDGQYQVSGDTVTLIEYKFSSQIPHRSKSHRMAIFISG